MSISHKNEFYTVEKVFPLHDLVKVFSTVKVSHIYTHIFQSPSILASFITVLFLMKRILNSSIFLIGVFRLKHDYILEINSACRDKTGFFFTIFNVSKLFAFFTINTTFYFSMRPIIEINQSFLKNRITPIIL